MRYENSARLSVLRTERDRDVLGSLSVQEHVFTMWGGIVLLAESCIRRRLYAARSACGTGTFHTAGTFAGHTARTIRPTRSASGLPTRPARRALLDSLWMLPPSPFSLASSDHARPTSTIPSHSQPLLTPVPQDHSLSLSHPPWPLPPSLSPSTTSRHHDKRYTSSAYTARNRA